MKILKEIRPWGEFEQFVLNEKCTVKILKLLPFQELSLQTHKTRNEFWTILDGFGYVFNNNENIPAKAGDSFYINVGNEHKAETVDSSMKILEISFGHFDENDEIRLSDKYGRVKK